MEFVVAVVAGVGVDVCGGNEAKDEFVVDDGAAEGIEEGAAAAPIDRESRFDTGGAVVVVAAAAEGALCCAKEENISTDPVCCCGCCCCCCCGAKAESFP